MDCANVTRIPTLYLPSAIPHPPDEHALTKTISRPVMASYQKSWLTWHSAMEMFFFVFHDTNNKYKCLRCELPIRNKCSVFEDTSSCRL